MQRKLVATAAVLAFLGVALGAFGTHGLRDRLDAKSLAIWQTAVQYQLIHALAILVTGGFPKAKIGGWLFAVGVCVFSGSLYLYALTGVTAFAIVTPLGGLLFLAGWAWLAFAALKPEPA